MKVKMNSFLLSGLIFLVISMLIWFLIPKEIQIVNGTAGINAQTFPKIITGIMAMLSALLIIQGVYSAKKSEYTSNQDKKRTIKREINGVVMLLIFLGYVLIIEKVGFIIASMMLCISCLAFYKVKSWKYYAITFATVFAVYFIFEQLLRLNLP